jgi:hypothetical protein
MELVFGHGVIRPPTDPELWPEWRLALHRWAETTRDQLGYDGGLYDRAEFSWSSSCFTSALVMLWDSEFYDSTTGRFTVESYLRRGEEQFGGYDAVVLWHAYPRIGVDELNQFDFYRYVPGGLATLREVSERLHANGVRVFVDYNPWDVGTRREQVGDADVLAWLVEAIDADGIFLDTMSEGEALRSKVDARKAGVVFESEGHLPLEHLHDHHMSWGQWFDITETVPAVLRNKWIERRHMQHLIHRWDPDHTDELHAAWMNGVGVVVWENVFGSWNGWNARDSALLKTMAPLQRRYADLFSKGSWTPLVPTLVDHVYASEWERDGLRLWTVVNRSDRKVEGPLIDVSAVGGAHYAELTTGRALQPALESGVARIAADLEPHGIACLVSAPDAVWQARVAPVLGPDSARPRRQVVRLAAEPMIRRTPPDIRLARTTPAGMVAFPAVTRKIDVVFRFRECGTYGPARPENRRLPAFHHHVQETQTVDLTPYAIDLSPVTNAEYALFLRETGYAPVRPCRFLAHWKDGTPPPGSEHLPVVHVDLDDARAYARWAGKRLPTEHEWQHALESGRVGFGNRRVWEWTESVHSDGHTRFCILKGGADHQAYGSVWYVDGGPRPPQFAVKFILSWPELDRCSTVGFRCAVDLPAGTEISTDPERSGQ